MKPIILLLLLSLLSCNSEIKDSKSEISENETYLNSTDNFFMNNKKVLDSLFLLYKDSSQFKYQDLYTTLFIGHLFSNVLKHAVLRYKENDTITNVSVLRLSQNKSDTIFSTKIFPVYTSALDNLLQISDYNGDKIPDLKVVKDFWDMHPGDNSYLWLYHKDQFTWVEGFESIISASYDKNTNLIYSYRSKGCADMSMYFGIYKIAGNKVKKMLELNCDCCIDKKDSCEIEIIGKKSFFVPYQSAYKYVPQFFAEGVKDKCELTIGK